MRVRCSTGGGTAGCGGKENRSKGRAPASSGLLGVVDIALRQSVKRMTDFAEAELVGRPGRGCEEGRDVIGEEEPLVDKGAIGDNGEAIGDDMVLVSIVGGVNAEYHKAFLFTPVGVFQTKFIKNTEITKMPFSSILTRCRSAGVAQAGQLSFELLESITTAAIVVALVYDLLFL
ncbi:hypothetical protein PG993_013528 [Apiospora rasikravindrae]|uniref:Uncharacterized protein n=1 Tax=Apiospora rasikravindrae TaxID=990691 RepID=A0ABR1RZG4_9PEZI